MRRLPAAVLAALLAVYPVAAAAAATPPWRAAGDMATEHIDQTATLLYDGRVLVVGGHEYNSDTPSGVEIYDPSHHAWRSGPAAGVARAGQAAVRLDDGRVLVAGGVQLGNRGPHAALASAELFDPRSGAWAPAATMAVARYHPTLTLLADGRVLVAGGGDGFETATAAAELYDPAADRWTPVAPMSTPRQEASALLLRGGQVLVAGGQATGTQAASLASAELYDYRTNHWTSVPDMHQARASAVVALVQGGSALVAGGFDYAGGFGIATSDAEYYRPGENRWFDAPPLQMARGGPGYATLRDGTVLVVGGQSRVADIRTQTTGEVLNPANLRWTLLPSMGETRSGPTVTALPSGQALVVGGGHEQTAQLYQPGSTPVVTAPSLTGAIAANRGLLLVSSLLLVVVLGQLAWRARGQAGGGR